MYSPVVLVVLVVSQLVHIAHLSMDKFSIMIFIYKIGYRIEGTFSDNNEKSKNSRRMSPAILILSRLGECISFYR